MCYSMDDEQEENEKKKVYLETFSSILIHGHLQKERMLLICLFIAVFSLPFSFYYSDIHVHSCCL